MNDKTLAATFLIWEMTNNKCDQLDGTVYFHSLFFFFGINKWLLRKRESRFIRGTSHTLPVTVYSWSAGWHIQWEEIINSCVTGHTEEVLCTFYMCEWFFSRDAQNEHQKVRFSLYSCRMRPHADPCCLYSVLYSVVMTPAWWFKKRVALSLFQNEAQ